MTQDSESQHHLNRPTLIQEIRQFARSRWQCRGKIYNIVNWDNDWLCSGVQLLSSFKVWLSVIFFCGKKVKESHPRLSSVWKADSSLVFVRGESSSPFNPFWHRNRRNVCLKSPVRRQASHEFDTFMMIPSSMGKYFLKSETEARSIY